MQVTPIGFQCHGDPQEWPHWVKTRSLQVTGETAIWEALGPNADDVLALNERLNDLTPQDAERLAPDGTPASAWPGTRPPAAGPTRSARDAELPARWPVKPQDP
ncbi:hypothetical protein ABZ468_50220 [Streptomyces sp. NPDC005708]|uniref:hypothetical protein n=1 Tax=unclassified Streptomyces TaxID=2593676 RepID=UPI0033E3BE19